MNFQGPSLYPSFPGHPHMMAAQEAAIKQYNATLYIGDIEEQVNEGMLHQFFMKFGPIYSVRIMRDFYNQKKSRGFGYVTYYSPKDAEAARINANHEVIVKKPIRVTWKKNFRDLDKEANVYIRNINKELNIRELDSYFSKFGAIFSSKIALDENGESLGYGYVQFEKKEQAEACLREGEIHNVKGHNLKVEKFQPSKARDKKDLRNNLYIKNLPNNIEESELKEKLTALFGNHGEILSLYLKLEKNLNKYFCFCCFKTNLEATQCLNALYEKDPFNLNEKLFITFAEKKENRTRKLRESFANILNETNLFTKNLRKDVTEVDLVNAFKVYGEVSSAAIKEGKTNDPKIPLETNCGFICFSRKEEAKNALSYSSKNPQILALFKDQQCFLTYHYRKEQYALYKEMRRRTMAKYFQRQFMNPMFMFPMPPPMFPPGQFFPPNFAPHQMINAPPPAHPSRYMGPPQESGYNRGGQKRGPPAHRRQDNQRRPNNRGPKNYQAQETRPQQPIAEAPAATETFTISQLKEKLTEFLGFPQDKQRAILGELLFPLVQKHVSHETMAPKVTGMLIDFSVFEVTDIIEFLENEETLHERVAEAEELIISTSK